MDFPKKRILCVDDDSSVCDLVSYLLRGFEVISASNKREAIGKASAHNFDLILLDYHLPDGNGLELCLFIRQFDKETPILFITATAFITKHEVLAIGAQGLIKKGLELANDLAFTVERLVSRLR